MSSSSLSLRAQRSLALNDFAATLLNKLSSTSKRARLALSAVNLSNEHHSALVRLVLTEHYASAAAMLRLIGEASACAHWIAYVADSEWVSRAEHDSTWDTPNLDDMIRALANSGLPIEGIEALRKLLQRAEWRRFHKFTHGGLVQLTRRERAETFSETENFFHLNLADSFFLAGVAVGTVLAPSDALFDFVGAERKRVNCEAVDLFGAARAPEWRGLPPTPFADEID